MSFILHSLPLWMILLHVKLETWKILVLLGALFARVRLFNSVWVSWTSWDMPFQSLFLCKSIATMFAGETNTIWIFLAIFFVALGVVNYSESNFTEVAFVRKVSCWQLCLVNVGSLVSVVTRLVVAHMSTYRTSVVFLLSFDVLERCEEVFEWF
jgi:hypothetical protein